LEGIVVELLLLVLFPSGRVALELPAGLVEDVEFPRGVTVEFPGDVPVEFPEGVTVELPYELELLEGESDGERASAGGGSSKGVAHSLLSNWHSLRLQDKSHSPLLSISTKQPGAQKYFKQAGWLLFPTAEHIALVQVSVDRSPCTISFPIVSEGNSVTFVIL
jgi:hypothetical protein